MSAGDVLAFSNQEAPALLGRAVARQARPTGGLGPEPLRAAACGRCGRQPSTNGAPLSRCFVVDRSVRCVAGLPELGRLRSGPSGARKPEGVVWSHGENDALRHQRYTPSGV